MKITGAVRVIKGQEVLPDSSTLDEHGIIDGSTVNIVIEPEKEIILKIKLGGLESTQNVSSSVRVRELKQQLIDGGILGFKFKDFSLLVPCANNDGIPANILLQDESLPLHLCGISDQTAIKILGGRVTIQLVNQKGKKWYKTFSKSITVAQMKQTILSADSIFGSDHKNLVTDVWLFLECGDSYRELDDEATIGAVLSDNDIVYFIEDRFFPEAAMIPLRLGEKIASVGYGVDDTVLSVKLRTQAQFGFPVSCMRVSLNVLGINLKNDRTIKKDTKYRISVW